MCHLLMVPSTDLNRDAPRHTKLAWNAIANANKALIQREPTPNVRRNELFLVEEAERPYGLAVITQDGERNLEVPQIVTVHVVVCVVES
jgi:hypothetical protein